MNEESPLFKAGSVKNPVDITTLSHNNNLFDFTQQDDISPNFLVPYANINITLGSSGLVGTGGIIIESYFPANIFAVYAYSGAGFGTPGTAVSVLFPSIGGNTGASPGIYKGTSFVLGSGFEVGYALATSRRLNPPDPFGSDLGLEQGFAVPGDPAVSETYFFVGGPFTIITPSDSSISDTLTTMDQFDNSFLSNSTSGLEVGSFLEPPNIVSI